MNSHSSSVNSYKNKENSGGDKGVQATYHISAPSYHPSLVISPLPSVYPSLYYPKTYPKNDIDPNPKGQHKFNPSTIPQFPPVADPRGTKGAPPRPHGRIQNFLWAGGAGGGLRIIFGLEPLLSTHNCEPISDDLYTNDIYGWDVG